MSDKKTLPVRIHEGFMEIGRFDHVAVYSGLRGRQRNSRRTPVSTPRGRFLSRVLDYAQKARVGRRPARLLARPHSRLTFRISTTSRGESSLIKVGRLLACVLEQPHFTAHTTSLDGIT